QAEDGIRDRNVTGVQTCALPILIGAAELLSTRELRATDVISFEPLEAVRRVHAQIRAHGEATPATILEVPATSAAPGAGADGARSEERRVGKGGRWRGEAYHRTQ